MINLKQKYMYYLHKAEKVCIYHDLDKMIHIGSFNEDIRFFRSRGGAAGIWTLKIKYGKYLDV